MDSLDRDGGQGDGQRSHSIRPRWIGAAVTMSGMEAKPFPSRNTACSLQRGVSSTMLGGVQHGDSRVFPLDQVV